MKTDLSIYLDYSNAMAQAGRLDEAASILRTQAGNLEDSCADIDESWKGEDAELYINKCRAMISYLEKAARNTGNAADTIRMIAERTYQAEKRALEIVRMRTYR